MSTVKTAISLDAALLAEIDKIAGQTKSSRSMIFRRAAVEFAQRYRAQILLTKLNEAYSTDSDTDVQIMKVAKRKQKKITDRW